jgi:hypothetical protein
MTSIVVDSGHSQGPRAGQARRPRIGDLRDQPIITRPRDAGIGLYWPFLKLCAKAAFQPNVVKEAR